MQVVLSHTPFQQLTHLKDKPVLLAGLGRLQEVQHLASAASRSFYCRRSHQIACIGAIVIYMAILLRIPKVASLMTAANASAAT